MKQLTNSERRLVLEDAIKRIEWGDPWYMCGAIEDSLIKFFPTMEHNTQDYNVVYFHFPELLNFKPEKTFMNSNCWFGSTAQDREKRIDILTTILNGIES